MSNHTLHTLGRNQAFHRDLRLTSDRDQTWKSLDEIRGLLIDPPRRGNHGGGRTRGRIKLRQNPLALNNAQKGCLFNGVPCRVRSGVPMRQQTELGIIRTIPCPHWNNSDLGHAHSCEVLGPQACADCIKARKRFRLSDQARGTFPGLDTDERSLCWSRRVKALISPRRLPAIRLSNGQNKLTGKNPGVKQHAEKAFRGFVNAQGGNRHGTETFQNHKLTQVNRTPPQGGPCPATSNSRSDSHVTFKSRGIDYGDHGNIRLRTEMTKYPTETFSAIKRTRQNGVVTDTELHRRVMRKHLLKQTQLANGMPPEPDVLTEHIPKLPERTVTIVLPSVHMKYD